jgi:hypothetical protein
MWRMIAGQEVDQSRVLSWQVEGVAILLRAQAIRDDQTKDAVLFAVLVQTNSSQISRIEPILPLCRL